MTKKIKTSELAYSWVNMQTAAKLRDGKQITTEQFKAFVWFWNDKNGFLLVFIFVIPFVFGYCVSMVIV